MNTAGTNPIARNVYAPTSQERTLGKNMNAIQIASRAAASKVWRAASKKPPRYWATPSAYVSSPSSAFERCSRLASDRALVYPVMARRQLP